MNNCNNLGSNKNILEIGNSYIKLFYIHYCQNTSVGCGVASFLMSLSGINRGYIPTIYDEYKWVKKLRHMRGGIPLFEIIKMIDLHNIKMDVFYGKSIIEFNENDPLITNYIKSINYMIRKGSLKYKENQNITIQTIIGEIKKGRYVLINGSIGGTIHMRLCFGFDGNKLLIADPLYHEILTFNEYEFEYNCNPPYGKWFVSLYK